MATSARKHNDYTVGWVCALPKEQTAAMAMLDERHETLPKPSNDSNAYTLGSIGRHNIVIACLPKGKIGTSSAAAVASRMVSTFPAIRFGLMVGIGGGVQPKVRLGDVVVGVPTGQHPGVVQWDMGKAEAGGQFRRTGVLNNPPTSLLTALTQLVTKQEMEGSRVSELVESIGAKYPRLASKYVRSDRHKDNLFKANYTHVSENAEGSGLEGGDHDDEDEEELDSEEEDCHLCDFTKTVKRKQRDMKVHHGTIASGNQVVKDAAFRDQLSKDLGGIMCIEMEAAGLPDSFPCIVVRGICDYADSHKNKIWQEHAAAVAAAYAKELLECVQPFEVAQEQTAQQQLGEKVDKLADGVHEVQQHLLSEADRRILDWLSPLDYGPQHSDHLQQREEGTGNWFLESDKYLEWLETPQETLFCPGIPGAGKTILSSIVINDIETRSDDTVGISYIYLDYRHRDDQTVTKLLCCIAKQLGRTRSLPQYLRSIYEHHKSKNTNPNLVEIKSVVNSLVALYARVYIIVDAVDEYQECHGGRSDFLSEIFDLQAKHITNIFATSRFIPEIVTKFDENDILEIRAKGDDVQRYLRRHINHLPSVVQQDSKLQTEVIVTISEVIDGMFLLARIYLESLRDKLTRRAMLTALGEMRDLQKENRKSGQEGSQGVLTQAYKGVVDRVQSQMDGMRDLAIRALSWITFARRPLSPQELQYALGVEPYQLEFDEDNLPPLQDVLAVCCGLVTLDRESDAIRLVHYTTQEYLESRPQEFFSDVHSFLTTICTTYLSCHTFEGNKFLTDYPPLYEYAACNWGHHAIHTSCCDYTEHFLKKPKAVQASFCILWASNWYELGGRFEDYLAPGLFRGTMTGLQLAAFLVLSGR
ncbi:hypothetical protein PG993_013706 [Apiospora rasikravindrae]|uniref:Nucleoside phosphorylase domain-containing protein n=1 Tax=Apiospora rasikravindrae TaxID=990691 RepID=A0ABR1RQZ6_9PEZI